MSPRGRGQINYRAVKSPEAPINGVQIWWVEYDANGYWGFRGQFEERDGKFYFDDKEFHHPDEVVDYRRRNL